MPRPARFDAARLTLLARQQNQLVTHPQLLELGLARSTIGHRLRPGGPWQRMLPGIVLLHTGPPTARQRQLAALLYAGPSGMLTGAESLRLRGFRRSDIDPYAVHILVPDHRHLASSGFVMVERTERLPAPNMVNELPTAPVARAVIDTARRCRSLDSVRALIAEAVQQRHCSHERLLDELRLAQRRGTARPRRVLAEVTAGIRSVEEARFRELLIARGIEQPMWNVDLRQPDGRFIAAPDAWWDEQAVAVEIDSREWHFDPQGWERTLKRHTAMAALGITVLHVTPRLRHDDPDGVIKELRTALQSARARPRPDIIVTKITQYSA